MKPDSTTKPDSSKGKAVDLAITQIERQYGKGAIMKLGAEAMAEGIPTLSTGSLSLDIALGVGGLPRGRVVEIFGPESSGKTTLALHVIAEAQKKGGIAVFIDADGSPALVDIAGGVQNADFFYGTVHRDQVFVVNPEICSQGAIGSLVGAHGGEDSIGIIKDVLPGILRADAMLVPAFHSAAGAGAGIVFAWPFVIATGHLIEHSRTDRRNVSGVISSA